MARDEKRRRNHRPATGERYHADNYEVVCARDPEELVRMVRDYIDRGWALAGGVATLPRGGPALIGGYFYQAVYLPSE